MLSGYGFAGNTSSSAYPHVSMVVNNYALVILYLMGLKMLVVVETPRLGGWS